MYWLSQIMIAFWKNKITDIEMLNRASHFFIEDSHISEILRLLDYDLSKKF